MVLRKRVTLFLSLLACSLLLVGPALATPSYHVSDVSYGNDDRVEICDRESDGNIAHAEYRDTGGSTAEKSVADDNGADPGCSQRGVDGRLSYHETCELLCYDRSYH